MRLTLIFFAVFAGTLLLFAGLFAFYRSVGKFIDWLTVKTGRSETQVSLALYVVFIALVFAGGITAAIAAGGKS